MADLAYNEKRAIEKLFRMEGGYVLDFSNRTFADFIADTAGIDIDDPKYLSKGTSKANRFRIFLKVEDDHCVGHVLSELIEQVRDNPYESDHAEQESLKARVRQIAERLTGGHGVEDIHVLAQTGSQSGEERNFRLLSVAVRKSIEDGEPEAALDRLHTNIVKYMRQVCAGRNVSTAEDRPLHSLIGEYTKAAKVAGLLESEITERILKNSIGIMEAFNFVRNRQSLAHDNQLLGKVESTLIVSHVISTVRFIQSLERRDRNET